MINTQTFIAISIMAAFGILFPLILSICWLKKKKEKITTVLIGAATWFLFSIVLESVPKAILFNPMLSIGKKIMSSAVLFTVLGASLAGIFEETGRYLAFRFVLKKRTNKETGISHGIGHGGFEAMFLLVISAAQNLTYAVLINQGKFPDIIKQTAALGVDTSALEALPEQLMAFTPVTCLVSCYERIFAVLLHISLSVLVFYSVKKRKISLYFLAVLLHTLFDVPAALYQFGIIKNIYVVEGMLSVYSVVFFIIIMKLLYGKDIPEKTENTENTEKSEETV